MIGFSPFSNFFKYYILSFSFLFAKERNTKMWKEGRKWHNFHHTITTTTNDELLTVLATDISATGFDAKSYENANDNKVAVPFIDLYDSSDIYTYTGSDYAEGWR